MDTVKLQTEILNRRFPIGAWKKPFIYFHEPMEEKYYIAPCAHVMFVVDTDLIMLDMQKVGASNISCMNICESAKKSAKTELKLKKGITIDVPDSYGKKAVYLEGDNDLRIMVNEAYLKLMTKNEKDVQYFGSAPLAPVLVKAHDDIIGVISSMRQNEV